MLQRWYLQRERTAISAHLFYSEPVRVQNTTSFDVYFTSRDPVTGRPVTYGTTPFALSSRQALFPAKVSYADNNRRVLIELSNYCASHTETSPTDACMTSTTPSENLFAFLNRTATTNMGFFLTADEGAVLDFAAAPNPSLRIVERKSVAESGPGNYTCSSVFLVVAGADYFKSNV